MKTFLALLLWCFLLVICWPVALLAIFLLPVLWVILLPFRLAGLTLTLVFNVVGAIFSLPFKMLRRI